MTHLRQRYRRGVPAVLAVLIALASLLSACGSGTSQQGDRLTPATRANNACIGGTNIDNGEWPLPGASQQAITVQIKALEAVQSGLQALDPAPIGSEWQTFLAGFPSMIGLLKQAASAGSATSRSQLLSQVGALGWPNNTDDAISGWLQDQGMYACEGYTLTTPDRTFVQAMDRQCYQAAQDSPDEQASAADVQREIDDLTRLPGNVEAITPRPVLFTGFVDEFRDGMPAYIQSFRDALEPNGQPASGTQLRGALHILKHSSTWGTSMADFLQGVRAYKCQLLAYSG